MNGFIRWFCAQLDADERREHGKYTIHGSTRIKCPECPTIAHTVTEHKREVTFDPCGHTMDGEDFIKTFATPDPDEFVLADIAAKRRIIEEFRWWWDRPQDTESDAELHARFAHPEYEYETTEGPRKMWEYADDPPYGDDGKPDHTWERNVDAGRNGWERFDYTEESYWRRRLPDDEIERRRKASGRPPMVLRLLASPYAGRDGYQGSWRP